MDFLDLTTLAISECGASGTSISTVVGATGEPLRFTGWINRAWVELQTKHDDWTWMRSSALLGGGVSFNTIDGQAFYQLGTGPGQIGLAVSSFGKWADGSFRNSPLGTPTGEIFMAPISFDGWRDAYMYGAERNARTRPIVLAIGPNQEICVGPVPSVGWTLTGDYYLAPTTMAADTDTPTGLPASHHMLLVYQTMIYYGEYEAAPEVVTRGQQGYGKLIRELEALRGPRVTAGPALA